MLFSSSKEKLRPVFMLVSKMDKLELMPKFKVPEIHVLVQMRWLRGMGVRPSTSDLDNSLQS